MDYTTLNKIREHSPCEDGWQKLLKHLRKTKADDDLVSFKVILDCNGIDDAIWCLKAHESDNKVRLFNCDVAEHVLHIFKDKHPEDNRPENAINVARDFANGNATQEELAAARAAALAAAWAASGAAALAAALAASGAASGAAAWAAAWAAEIKFQTELFTKTFCQEE